MENTEKLENLETRILEAEEKLKKSRNSVEKSVLCDQIKRFKKEITDLKYSTEEPKLTQVKDVPLRMDHVDEKTTPRGGIVNNGNTFITTI